MTDEAENENAVTPTRSLFGGNARVESDSSEGDTVATEPADERSEAEETIEDAATFVEALTVPDEPVTEEPEPVVAEEQEAVSNVEVASEADEEPVGDVPLDPASVPESNGTADGEDAVASTEPTEDTIPSVNATEVVKSEELAKLDVAALKAEREKLDTVILSKQEQERRSVISQIAAVVKLYDIPLLELFKSLGGVPNPRKGEKAPITHRDENGNTWTGRGKTPKWLKDKNPDDYRVK